MATRRFSQVKISGVSAAVPNKVKKNNELGGELAEIAKIAKIVGVESRYLATETICTSDLCAAAAEQLLSQLKWEKNSVDALIFLSQTPDYLLPATSCVLQHRLGLSTQCAAFDMSLGCSGYIYGLLTAFSLIAEKGIRRVLLLVGDTISKVLSPHDMPANILFGDAGTATAIEFDETAGDSVIAVGTDGSSYESLIVEAGGFRKRKSDLTGIKKPHKKDNVLRSEEELFMDGSAVFSFTLSQVPLLVKNVLHDFACEVNKVDYWLFHQANKFMLNYLRDKSGISAEKMLMNIDRVGNTSPPSIPLLMVTEDLQKLSCDKSVRLGMVGFGVGFSWGAALVDVKNLIVPELIKVNVEELADVS